MLEPKWDPDRRWIVVDMDGTLANCTHRVPLLPDWDAFHSASVDDQPYAPMVDLVNMMSDYFNVLILTGRTITHVDVTRDWLANNKVNHQALSMRPETDFRPDVECKWQQAVKFFGSEQDVIRSVAFVFDDREKVVAMWRDKGLICLQPREGDF